MAKALMGHVGTGLDLRMASELKRMRDRVRDLENEAIRLRAENVELRSVNTELSTIARVDEEMMRLTVSEQARDHEPALT
ncbi:MAG TPA: hypothetical protein VHW74_17465 [Mycobacteriales bacterium]|jgi:hypothetical protein|nr:hypothetical protein [Mycobacteriales bacterium]